MTPEAVQDLRLCHAALLVEQATAAPATRRLKAEALQRVLWANRDALVQIAQDHEAAAASVRAHVEALRPFARCVELLAEGQNPVIISLPSPSNGGRTFIQLRPEHFRRAAEMVEAWV